MFVGISAIISSKIQIPMVIFQGFQIAIGSVLTIFFRKWTGAQKDKRLASEEMVWVREDQRRARNVTVSTVQQLGDVSSISTGGH